MSSGMQEGTRFRGQPLLLIGVAILGWIVLRVAVWQPAGDRLTVPSMPATREVPTSAPADSLAQLSPLSEAEEGKAEESSGRRIMSPLVPWTAPPLLQRVEPMQPAPGWESSAADPQSPAASQVEGATNLAPPHMVVGHNLLFAAGLSQMEVPPALFVQLQRAARNRAGIPSATPPAIARPQFSASSVGSRWSADGWLLLRDDNSSPLLSSAPSYGRSQLGAVLRYRLAPASQLRPQAYLRGSAALAEPGEREIAAGLSARPVPGMPVRLAAELRASDSGNESELRPAAFAVSEFPPLELAHGLRAEAYLQAGYVGGRFATGFADGQARIEGELAELEDFRMSAGAGAWGGAQKGSARLDIGPSAAVSFRLGDARGRVAADYRFRVAGNAEPSSGPALTLSAGF